MELRRANVLNRSYPPGFRVDLHHKDLGIALDSAGQASVPLPLTAGTQQLLRQLRAAGRGGEDHTAILAAVEAQAAPGAAAVPPGEETG
jgi:2-hydroxy-3-oxopropionate reductase